MTVRLPPLPPKTMFSLGMTAVLAELPLKVMPEAIVSASDTVNAMGPVLVFCVMVWFAMEEMTGGEFVTITVRTNDLTAESEPSLTVTVMVVDPIRPATGVTVTVRLDPLPLKTRLGDVLGTRIVSEELAVTESELAAVSSSPIVKGSGPVKMQVVVLLDSDGKPVDATIRYVTD